MQKSSNSLFHFTGTLDILFSILRSKFYGSYCKERFAFNELDYVLYVPKISFCDIPEETIPSYSHYGKYGIGLSKEWGQQKRLTPVLYIDKHSIIAESFIKAFHGVDSGVHLVNKSILELRVLFNNIKSDTEIKDDQRHEGYDLVETLLDQVDSLGKIVTFGQYMPFYVKHYEDELVTKNGAFPNYRFYDEREWCYVPEELQRSNRLYKNQEQYNDWRLSSERKGVLEEVSLEFDFQDISHLIVESKEDKLKLGDQILRMESDKMTDGDRLRLVSLIQVFGD